MTALELMERLGGEVLNNKIRVYIEGEIVIVARLEDQDWVLTDRGVLLTNEQIIPIVVDLPAPFGPNKAKKSPSATRKSIPLSACNPLA